jgi:hypothetical protein
MISNWYLDIAPAKFISVRTVVILADLWPNFSAECQYSAARCVTAYLCCSGDRSAGCAGQEIDVQSFHLVPVQITVSLNTPIECYCRMWLSQQSSNKENTCIRV